MSQIERTVERIIESEVDDNAWRQHISRYEFAKPYVEGKPILDIACGTGYGTFFLARSCNTKIIGVDVSNEAVNHAKTHYSHPGLEYRLGDAMDLSPYKGVGAVVSLETIEHLQDPDRFLTEVVKLLPPEGTFIVSTPNRASGKLTDKPRNPFHVREWNAEEFMALLSKYFGRVEFHDQFLYVAPLAYPGSRTVANLIIKMVRPQIIERLGRWDVTRPEPTNLPLVHVIPRYIVAVCSQPKQWV